MLVLKTNIYQSKLIENQYYASLIVEHPIPDFDLMDEHQLALCV